VKEAEKDAGMDWLRDAGAEVHVRVKALPNAGASAVVGIRNGELVVRLGAQPEKGKANRELVDLLAGALGVPRSSLRIVTGETARHKVVAVPAALKGRMQRLAGGDTAT
jgi:uncharacterized protein